MLITYWIKKSKTKQNILGHNWPMFMIRRLGTVKPMIRGKQR